MKSLMLLTECVLADAKIWCNAETHPDVLTVRKRVIHEGVSFLTITLPDFARGFEKGLERGRIDLADFKSFKSRMALPAFLQGLLCQVFDQKTGYLLNLPSHTAIYFVRQIALLHKKVRLPCSLERERKAYASFVKCENDIKNVPEELSERQFRHFGRVSDMLWGRVLCNVNNDVFHHRLVPRHGPGATAERITGNGKYVHRRWHARLEEHFPLDLFAIVNWNDSASLQSIDIVPPEQEQPTRLISVPKTLKTPRLIAIEPVCMQYTQQALLQLLVPELERSPILQGALGFTDQSVNNTLAKEGSISGNLATLDLSEASDRVHNVFVERMLKSVPAFSSAVQACRSTATDVPTVGKIALSKFASMGSALCFPIEAMFFLTVLLAGLTDELCIPVTCRNLSDVCKRLRIYGDDIIVPSEYVEICINSLHDFGLKVNDNKSFWNGKFRESCGRDYYAGEDVTVVYNRSASSIDAVASSDYVSVVSFRNQCYYAGLWQTAEAIDRVLCERTPYPIVTSTSSIVSRQSILGYSTERWCKDLHKPLVRGRVISAPLPSDPLDGYAALLKVLLNKEQGNPLFQDKDHLLRAGRPKQVRTKLRWASPL